jgi:PEGA domain
MGRLSVRYELPEKLAMQKTWKILTICVLLGLGAHIARAQAMAEAGMVTSNSSTAASATKSNSSTPANSPARPSSQHLLAKTGPPPPDVNRKEFEDNAGQNAGKVLFRSAPDGAEIFVNDLIVGRTPLLMMLAPGNYKIEMRGPRGETGHAAIGVLAKETQTIKITLKQRYPSSVSAK